MHATKWLLAGGGCLAFGAAFSNMGVLLHTQTSVCHLTGDIARLSMDLAYWSPEIKPELFRVACAAFSFLLGALLAGFIIHHPTLDVSRPYGRTVTSIGILLLMAHVTLERWQLASIAMAAMGCGLQNALASHYRGIVLRTTHITGLMTDLGVTLGMRIRGHDIPLWKIAVPLLLILAFFGGGLCAAMAHSAGINPIAAAGLAYTAGGLCWSLKKILLQTPNPIPAQPGHS
jgi:uncharacterized membrane protein YoaK (UPF0700 family)